MIEAARFLKKLSYSCLTVFIFSLQTDKVNEIEERLDDFQVQLLSNDASRNANETPGTTDVIITEAGVNTSNAEAVDDREGNNLCPLLQSQVAKVKFQFHFLRNDKYLCLTNYLQPDLSQASVKDSVLPIPLPSSEQSKEIGTSNNSIPPRKRKRSDSDTNLYTKEKVSNYFLNYNVLLYIFCALPISDIPSRQNCSSPIFQF